MKTSIFNTYIRLSDTVGVIYNSFLDKAVFADGAILQEILNSNDGHYNFSKEISDTLFVEDDVDEYSLYSQEVLAVENQTASYHLIINPTLECIFNCWYCYEEHPKGRIDKYVLDNIFKLINNLSYEYESLTISFFGGEPLMCYGSAIIPIVKHANDIFSEKGKTFNFNMTTNGFLLSEERTRIMKQYGFTGAQITIDGDVAYHNKIRFLNNSQPTYDRIIDNIKMLVRNDCPVTVRLNCTHDNIMSFYSLSDVLNNLDMEEKNRITIDCHIVWQEKQKEKLEDKMHLLVAHLVQSGLKANKMDFRQFCYADKRSQCLVNYNGDVYKCTALDFKNVRRDGFLTDNGEVVWENDSLERRMDAKRRNMRCRNCRILPLCHGGCSTKALSSDNYCLYPTDDMKDQVVINRLEHIITLHEHA